MIARLKGPFSLQTCIEYHERAKCGDSHARNELVTSCLPVANTVVEWFVDHTNNFEDLRAEANLETVLAVDGWNPDDGALGHFVIERVATRLRSYLGISIRKCDHCGTSFCPIQPTQIYCSSNCKSYAWRKRTLPKKKEQGVCDRCTQPVVPGKVSCQRHLEQQSARHRRKHGWYKTYNLTCEICEQSFVAQRKFTKYCGECKGEAKKRRWQRHDRKKKQARAQAKRKTAHHEVPQNHLSYALGEFLFTAPLRERFDWSQMEPTDANPGSEEKMSVLQDRVAKGLPLFHPEDRTHKMPLMLGFETWLWDDHPEPTVNSHTNPKEHEYA